MRGNCPRLLSETILQSLLYTFGAATGTCREGATAFEVGQRAKSAPMRRSRWGNCGCFQRQALQNKRDTVMLTLCSPPSCLLASMCRNPFAQIWLVGSAWSCSTLCRGVRTATRSRAAGDKFAGEGTKVASVAVDDRKESKALVEKRKRQFPIACGAVSRQSAASSVLYEGSVTVVYSTRAIGRPCPRRTCFYAQIVTEDPAID